MIVLHRIYFYRMLRLYLATQRFVALLPLLRAAKVETWCTVKRSETRSAVYRATFTITMRGL